MPENNGQNINGEQKNSKNTLNHAQRMMRFRAIRAKKKQTFRAPNSGKFEHLRKTVETFKKNRDAYIKFKNHKMAEEMAQQNNEPKPEPVIEQVNQQKLEPEIKNENNLVIEEQDVQEEPRKPADKVAEENGAETMNFEDIEVDDAALDDPKLDEELEQLEQKIKKEEELKKMGVDPETVEEPDNPELAEEIKELMQETDEKLEGDALEEAFQKLSNEVEGEIKDSHADDLEVNDPIVDEEIKRLEQEIAAEAKVNPDPVPVNERQLTEEERARRAADDERLAQRMQNFRREMAELDAEEEREAQANEEEVEVEPGQERPALPLDSLFEEDDEEELELPHSNTIIQPQIPQIPQMPVANAEPQVEEAQVQENNNPPRELTEEEKARRAADDERLAQMMQNFRREMAELDAEEAAKEAAIHEAEENVEEAVVVDEPKNDVENPDILGGAAEMVAALDAEPAELDNGVSATVFVNTLNTFNAMYKLGIDANSFAFSVNEAWTLMKSGNEQKKADGQKMLGDLFKDTLKQAFDVEKGVAYDEHRLPEYAEIIKSSNELLRTAMFAFTDLYHDPKSASLFDSTAFGGLDAKEMADLTVGESLWSMDQKSDEAWEMQSKDAKNLADKWLSGDKPYEKMISEMKALVEADKDGIVDRKEVLTKLTAAEWLLVNNDKMMIDDPEDPLNKLPNWGNRYWKALTEAREALGIDKHTSMRDLIQSDYAASAKAVISSAYNEAQIEDYVLDPAAREIYDSMEIQKEQFATQSAAVTLTEPQNEKNAGEVEMTEDRVPYPIKELDERAIMKNQPKNYDFVVEKTAELNMNRPSPV